MAVRSPNINVMVSAAFKAARRLARDFGEIENLQVTPKGTEHFVATSREKASRVLADELAKARPDYGMVMAGAAARGGNAEQRWIVDPINGVLNFAHGIPNFALTIAVQSGAEVMAGIVYDPLRDDLFWSDKGTGAYINDHRLRVSGRKDAATALVGTYGDGAATEDAAERALAERAAGIRRMGCAALDLSDLTNDQRFTSNAGRLDNREDLASAITRRTQTAPAWWWVMLLRRHRVACSPVYMFDEMFGDPHFRSQDSVVDVETRWGTAVRGGLPWRFGSTPCSPIEGTHEPGSDEEEIMQRLREIEKRESASRK